MTERRGRSSFLHAFAWIAPAILWLLLFLALPSLLLLASLFVLGNFGVDVLYAWIDPRISFETASA